VISPFLPLPRPAAAGEGESLRLYSPLALALYAWLANLPIAVALLGINLRRRGRLMVGNTAIGLSVVAFLLFAGSLILSSRPPDIRLFGFFGGLLIYGLERPAFAAARSRGAAKARWWPPLLVLVAFMLITGLLALAVS
jgi:hypothetical protein